MGVAWRLKNVDPAPWFKRYAEGREKVTAIASELGVSAQSMRLWFIRHGLPTRGRGRPRKKQEEPC